MNEDLAAILIIAGLVLMFVLTGLAGYEIGHECGVKATQTEAAECGAGEYRADPETGIVEFIWRTE